MKRLFTILLSAVMFAGAAFAEDVVYLNNGSVIKGTVTADDGTNVTVQTKSGATLEYKKIEIRKIDKGESLAAAPETPKRAKYVDYDAKPNGWWCAVELMGGGSVDANYNPNLYNIGFSFINGYRFNQWIRIGIGIGFRYYLTTDKSFYHEDKYMLEDKIYEPKMIIPKDAPAPQYKGKTYSGTPWSVPLFVDIRGNFINDDTRQVVPYWAFDFGYTFSGNYLAGTEAESYEDRDGTRYSEYDTSKAVSKLGDGIFFAPTIGIKIGTERHNLLIGFTYMGQVLPRYGLKQNTDARGTDTYTPVLGARFTNFLCGKIAYEF